MVFMQMIPLVIVAAIFAAYAVWIGKKRAQGSKDLIEITAALLQQTGFRVASARNAPFDEHVRLVAGAFATFGGREGQEWIRDCGGIPLRHFQRQDSEGNRVFHWCKWFTPLGHPPRVRLQIVEKRLVGTMEGLGNFIENKSYGWTQRFPYKVPMGDPELDARFLFFGDDPDAVRHAIRAPGLRDLLLAATQVDAWVDHETVTASDPFRENFKAAMGGAMGALLGDAKGTSSAMIAVHERMSWIVAALARAST
jgi:hypothetical protein